MYTATYLVNYIPKEKKDLLGLDIDTGLYSSLEHIQSNIIPQSFPSVYNLYKNHKTEISEFIKTKLDNISTDDLEGFGKVHNNLNQLYNFNVFKPFEGEVDASEEYKFKNVFLNSCKDSDIVILIGSIRNESIEICNNILISPEELSGALKYNATLILGGFSKLFINKLNSFRKDLNIIFSTTVTSWIDYEDVIVYLNFIDNYYTMNIENICNYMSIGELKLRKSLMDDLLKDYFNSFDNGNRLISFLEGLYSSPIYSEIENNLSLKTEVKKDLVDYIIFIEAEMMCMPFAFILGVIS